MKPAVEEKTKPDADKLKALEDKLKKLQANGPRRELTMSVDEEKRIEDARVHVRGNVHNQTDLAPRGFLQVALTGPTPKFPKDESGRRQLADWLASKENRSDLG